CHMYHRPRHVPNDHPDIDHLSLRRVQRDCVFDRSPFDILPASLRTLSERTCDLYQPAKQIFCLAPEKLKLCLANCRLAQNGSLPQGSYALGSAGRAYQNASPLIQYQSEHLPEEFLRDSDRASALDKSVNRSRRFRVLSADRILVLAAA